MYITKRKILNDLGKGVDQTQWLDHLTPREQDVIRSTLEGLTAAMISKQLRISEKSVFRARHSAVKKLEKTSNAQSELTKEQDSVRTDPGTIWDSPRVKAILERPAGTPIDLSGLHEEERHALARAAQGMWADHPEITDSVKWVRELRQGWSIRFPEKK